ncbi:MULTISPECIES: hypothetical protein [unclassified Agrococcus]|uniref:hypothetical protein n=1 Tax=unclassified Agrococcus TaxID=2615065 RepID=UPI00361061AA
MSVEITPPPAVSRREIVEAAERIIGDVGAERFTTGLLLDGDTSATIGSVYRHFADRVHIIVAVRAENGRRMLDRINQAVLLQHRDVASEDLFHDAVASLYRLRPSMRHLRPGGEDSDAWWWALARSLHLAMGNSDRRRTTQVVRLHAAMVHAAFALDPEGDAAMLAQALGWLRDAVREARDAALDEVARHGSGARGFDGSGYAAAGLLSPVVDAV